MTESAQWADSVKIFWTERKITSYILVRDFESCMGGLLPHTKDRADTFSKTLSKTNSTVRDSDVCKCFQGLIYKDEDWDIGDYSSCGNEVEVNMP